MGFIFLDQNAFSQSIEKYASSILEPEITFLSEAPKIDGVLDGQLKMLPVRNFQIEEKSNSQNPSIDVHYRLAYGTEFFYLFIEVETDRFIYRDRGYQNGDGFIVVLCRPRPDHQPTDEFYVLGFTAQDSSHRDRYRKVLWYYNIDLILKPLSEKTKFEHQMNKGKAGFEVLIPWEEVYPNHPLISPAVGFNLAFIKAIGDREKNWHFVVEDENIESEQSNRRYATCVFQPPILTTGCQSYLIMDRHCQIGETITATLATVSADSADETISVDLNTDKGELIHSAEFRTKCNKGVAIKTYPIITSDLISGEYIVNWHSRTSRAKGNMGLTILPRFDFQDLTKRLEKIANYISTGSMNTLLFAIDHLQQLKQTLKPYETCTLFRKELLSFLDDLREYEKGHDVLAQKTGIFRRAFRSKIDSTLQPYSVKISTTFDPKKRYSLIVYLHGSGEDDRGILSYHQTPEGVIELAPYGRGTSNCFSSDHAQADIQEAIEDVICNYPVDASNIILSGFSMGGYGVLRTFYENPKRYKALAIFSGHPYLASQWLGGEHPNFLVKKYLKPFKNVPIFISHGKNDRNLPYELYLELVKSLKSSGAKVLSFVDEEGGHNITPKMYTEYFKWLRKIIHSETENQ